MKAIPSIDFRTASGLSRIYETIEVPSDSNPSKFYTVDLTNRRCSCPAWKFTKGERKDCKHLNRIGADRATF